MQEIPTNWKQYLSHVHALHEFNAEECDIFSGYLELLTFEAGQTLIHQGNEALDMDFLLIGEVKLNRQGIYLGVMKAGQHFGELGLLTGQVRSASIEALSSGLVARLNRDNYQRLSQEQPLLALKLLQALINHLGHSLKDMTDHFGLLLSERSLHQRAMIRIRTTEGEMLVKTGIRAKDVLHNPDKKNVAALLNQQAVSLDTQLFSDAQLSPLNTAHWEGERIYRRSTSLLMLEALHQLAPEMVLRPALSLGGVQWFESEQSLSDAAQLAKWVEEAMHAMVEAGTVFRSELWSIEEACQHFHKREMPDTAELLKLKRSSTVRLVSCGQFYALDLGPLVPDASFLTRFQVHPWAKGLVLTTSTLNGELASLMAPYAQLMTAQERWEQSLNIGSVGRFNQACIEGSVSETIRVAEGFHEKRLGEIADRIANQKDCRVICIAGPSSSGKTTFIKRLIIQLRVNGLRPIAISLDDYYCDRVLTPRDAQGNLDFEDLHALNLDLLQQHLSELMAGKVVKTAHYDFKSGTGHPDGGPELYLGQDQVLLLEGIHGLNPELIGDAIPQSQLFKLFVQPLNGLGMDRLSRFSTSDLRLLRRIVRDRHTRSTNAAETIERWPSVRAGEQRWIFPFVKEADQVFDTSLLYEIAVLKVYAERYLLEVPRSHPSFMTAYRLRELLELIVPIYPDHVPPTSIVREFIGNSGFEY